MPKKSINALPKFIQQVDWPVESICAFTTNRQPDLNKVAIASPYANFNLGLHVKDDVNQVIANRQQLNNYLPEGTNIQWLDQVHGNDVAIVEQVSSTPIVSDASITKAPNIALAIMTADCLPILLSDNEGSVIAAIHGGWRPLATGIIANTLDKMSVNPANVIAWLGPCIGPTAFEVGQDVKQAFCRISPELAVTFTQHENLDGEIKYLCNLQLIAQHLLKAEGVKNISALNHCTYSQPSLYYSYRRDHITGRMASIICAKSKS